MRKARWLAGRRNSTSKPVIYHCISRVVDRRFVFAERECEAFRMFLRMRENFSGCRVLSYCIMSNHFHLLLEVPPMAESGLSDEVLLQRLSALYSEAFVAGVAARTIAAYIDLNPVQAGMVKDQADYRLSSYGEAVGGGAKGNGKKAREGLVRAYFCDQGVGLEAEKWPEVSRPYRRLMGLALGKKSGRAEVSPSAKGLGQSTMNTAEMLESGDNGTVLKDLGLAKMLHCRVRYFTDGAVIGSKEFVNEVFASARERFGPKREDGARVMKGSGSGAKGVLWSLRVGV